LINLSHVITDEEYCSIYMKIIPQLTYTNQIKEHDI